jgi:hypothetical protein
VFYNGMGHVGFLGFMGLSGLVLVGVIVLVVVLATNASRRTEPPTGYGPPPPPPGYLQPGQQPGGAPYCGPAPRSVEQRLAELDDLLRRGVISPDEHAAARARILGEL